MPLTRLSANHVFHRLRKMMARVKDEQVETMRADKCLAL